MPEYPFFGQATDNLAQHSSYHTNNHLNNNGIFEDKLNVTGEILMCVCEQILLN